MTRNIMPVEPAAARVVSLAVRSEPSLADLAKRIKVECAAAEAAHQSVLEHAMSAGRLFIEAKAEAKRQKVAWLHWLAKNDIPERTAQIYMKLSKERPKLEANAEPRIRSGAADLSIRKALKSLPERKIAKKVLGTAEPAVEQPDDSLLPKPIADNPKPCPVIEKQHPLEQKMWLGAARHVQSIRKKLMHLNDEEQILCLLINFKPEQLREALERLDAENDQRR
jgi:hypothetical protein